MIRIYRRLFLQQFQAMSQYRIAMFLYSFLSGSLYLSPQMRKVKAVVARDGAESEEVSVLANRIFLAARVELVFLILIVADMVLKPFL